MRWGEHSQPEWYVAKRRAGGVEELSPFAQLSGLLICDEKPLGAATFSEEIWLVPGLPKNWAQVCEVGERGMGGHAKGMFMGQVCAKATSWGKTIQAACLDLKGQGCLSQKAAQA